MKSAISELDNIGGGGGGGSKLPKCRSLFFGRRGGTLNANTWPIGEGVGVKNCKNLPMS